MDLMTVRKAAVRLLHTSFVLLCKLLLVDVVCTFVSCWLVYFLLRRRTLTAPKSMHGDNMQSRDDQGIQVIICGFPRSGCTSLWQAMDILGLPCFHAFHLFKPSTAKLFMKAQTTGAHQDWERLLCGYKSIVDFPAASSYKELMDMYPSAKVILNIRDPKSWYNSFARTILSLQKNIIIQVVRPFIIRCTIASFYKKLLMGEPENEELSIANYMLHMEEVKKHVPPHKLLVWEIEKNEGWDPLCEFLEVSTPNALFPFANKTEDFKIVVDGGLKIHIIVLFSYLVVIFSIIIYGKKWISSM